MFGNVLLSDDREVSRDKEEEIRHAFFCFLISLILLFILFPRIVKIKEKNRKEKKYRSQKYQNRQIKKRVRIVLVRSRYGNVRRIQVAPKDRTRSTCM
ncbi:hypothetical protein V1478_010151 [Vespula squamosa]|uniref:Uncharacterized protein n=1 Tax=Vespula squamosa TaxID=30214 RepID=A0ABD2ALL4_VESSQ